MNIKAMLEAERIDPNLKSYTVDEAFAGKGLPSLHSGEAHRRQRTAATKQRRE